MHKDYRLGFTLFMSNLQNLEFRIEDTWYGKIYGINVQKYLLQNPQTD